ncbi:MAG: radical SAM protein [Thermoplasmata archaeon]|nr:MAG: radical SAM protein [Thermoplasmata archaeon]
MALAKVHEWERGSTYAGELPRGCSLCARGSKMVLLVTGRCSSGCFYCPLSEAKKGRDVSYANERPIDGVEEAIEEARTIDAEGTGVTGGDPVDAMVRTTGMIYSLKAAFGKGHHVHLYTARPLGEEELRELRNAGLDEVRFHPPVDALDDVEGAGYADAVARATAMGMEAGYEVPVLPDREDELRAFLETLAGSEDRPFVNLNELEYSTSNADELRTREFLVRDDVSAAVAGSEDLGRRLVEEFATSGLRVHYCSAAFKDGVQLRRRLGRRAKNVVRPHELVTEDQTLLKGVVETDDPEGVARALQTRFDVPPDLMVVDAEQGLLELAPWVIDELEEHIDGDCYLVEEYPTWDRLEVERTPVRLLKDL